MPNRSVRLTDSLPTPVAYFEFALRTFGTTASLRQALVEGTGVTASQIATPDGEITLGQQLRQVRNATLYLAPGWGLESGASLQASTHGPLGIAATCAPTLGDTLRVLERFSQVRNPSLRLRLARTSRECRALFEWGCRLLPGEKLPLFENFALSVQGMVEVVLGRPMREARFEVDEPPPPWSHRYPDFFHAPVRFDLQTLALVFPVSWLDLRSPFADPAMYGAAVQKLEGLARRLEGSDYLASRVEQLLIASGPAGLTLEAAARRLRLSRRTLNRRLHEHGTSYRDLRDAHRRRHAEELLRWESLSADQVALQLGYQDPANFGRACRRWFGASPGKLRRPLSGEDDRGTLPRGKALGDSGTDTVIGRSQSVP